MHKTVLAIASSSLTICQMFAVILNADSVYCQLLRMHSVTS